MYDLPEFKTAHFPEILECIERYPFAFVSGCTLAGLPVVTQLPLMYHIDGTTLFLQGHMMRNTDHFQAFSENPHIKAVFTGPNAYISANWYQNPVSASTWNYMSVHVSGTIRFLEGEEFEASMQRFTQYFEADQNSPTVFQNLPQSYTQALMPLIAGFEIQATTVEHVFKLSQNAQAASFQSVIHHLQSQGGSAAELASEMLKHADLKRRNS